MNRMGNLTGLIIAISLGLLGIFFSIRAGVHSFQLSRRQASWPERRKQVAAGRRYFGLAFILTVMIVAGVVMIFNGDISRPVLLITPNASPVRTVTIAPSKTATSTPALTSTLVLTDTPTLTSTPSPTLTSTLPPSQTPLPTDTLWPTWTPSKTPTVTPTLPSPTPTKTSTLFPTHTLMPTDTHWPTLTPTGLK